MPLVQENHRLPGSRMTELREAWDDWEYNPTPRTYARLTKCMAGQADYLADKGVETEWQEDLGIYCHSVLRSIVEFLHMTQKAA